jgi:NADPH:quinone reductase-like Zn-dependent oxidoreductase
MRDFPSFTVKKPCIPEFDVAGTVVVVRSNVKRWKIGDDLFGILTTQDVFKTCQGGLAEFTLAREEFLFSSSPQGF